MFWLLFALLSIVAFQSTQTRHFSRLLSLPYRTDFFSALLGSVEIGAGVLEMWCIERDGDREWKLEFDVCYNPT